MKVLSLIIFFLSTTIHLYGSLKKIQKIRNYTKPFILLSLIIFYILAAKEVRWTIILALIFSWIGDLFLIIPGVKYFTIGGISFMISHLFFIAGYHSDVVFSSVNTFVIIFLNIFFFITVSIIFKNLKPHLPKKLFYPMYLYLFINGTMNMFAIFRYLSNYTSATLTTCIGAILFFISDSSLFFVRFDKNCKLKTHFLVMLTYSIGELLIVLGLI